MQPINSAWLDFLPVEFHNRLIRDDSGEYWISCQIRSSLNQGDNTYYPYRALVIIESYSISSDGTIIFEDVNNS